MRRLADRPGLQVGAGLLLGSALVMASCVHPRGAVAPPPLLARVAIYYGWPSAVNGSRTPAEAVTALRRYQVLVLGAGLERAEHPDHRSTLQMVRELTALGVEVFGYIALGQATALTEGQVRAAVDAWRRVGVNGIFFDEAGYDFGSDRRRQSFAFEHAHARSLRVFANAHDPRDLLDDHHRPDRNPRAQPAGLVPGDALLYESFVIIRGRPEDASARRLKLQRLAPARQRGLRLFGVTTSPSAGWFDPELWRQTIAEAERAGLDGLGFGEADYAAVDARLPWRWGL